MREYTVLVAITVQAPDEVLAHHAVMHSLPKPPFPNGITSWWIAEDDRQENSDNDSAVFVKKGYQRIAREVLARG